MSFLKRLWLQQLTALAEASPRAYYAFVLLLSYIGYAFVLLFPITLILSVAFLAYNIYQVSPLSWESNDWLLALSLLVLSMVSARVSYVLCQVTPEQPAGKPLNSSEFPILVNRITELVTTYGAPPLHHIKLTTRFRIEIIRTPISGYPFRFINTLLIGLPVMSCASPLHLKLLLARQVGHLAKCRRSRSRRMVYLRKIWNIYQHHYSQAWKPDTALPRLFFSWYAPFFNLCAIPAVRLATIDKDQYMLDITSQENAAEVIAVFAIKKHYLKTVFWPELNESAYKVPTPTYLPFTAMDPVMTKKLTPDIAQRIYETEVNRIVEADSEIPNLMRRLRTLGHDDFVTPSPKKETAAQHFLGDKLSLIQKQLDNIWYLKNKGIWAKHYHQGVEEKKRLKILREQATHALLSNDEAREYLLLIEKYMDPDKALPLYKEIIKTSCMDGDVCYELGRLLLLSDDSGGVNALQRAMDINAERTADCCHHIVDYMVRHGNVKEAQHYRRIIIEHQVAQ